MEDIRNKIEDQIIFNGGQNSLADIIAAIGMIIFYTVPFILIFRNIYFIILVLSLLTFLLFYAYRYSINYTITSTEIIFYSTYLNQELDRISNTDILQIRFEDGFNTGRGNTDKFLMYMKKGVKPKVQMTNSGYISLIIGNNKEIEIISIMNHFQRVNVDVKIKTTNKRIKLETGLKNWDLT